MTRMHPFTFTSACSSRPGRVHPPLPPGPDSNDSVSETSSSWKRISIGKIDGSGKSDSFSGRVSPRKKTSVGKNDSRVKYNDLWWDLFSNPSHWWDHRSGKRNSNFPDFKHKRTGDALWLDNDRNPPWVASELVGFTSDSGRENYEKLWRDLFADPSQWWDHRQRKGNPKIPDFKHKKTGEALWLNDERTPPWVASEVAVLGPGMLQLRIVRSVQKISRYHKARNHVKVMERFEEMQQEGIEPDHYVFLHVLNACGALRYLEEGRRVHAKIIESACESNPHVASSLIEMYSKCGSLVDARRVFDKMPREELLTWTAMIQGCVNCGQLHDALELFHQMQLKGMKPHSTSFVALLGACARDEALEVGRLAHKVIISSGCETDADIVSSLVDMYAKCGSLEEARTVFKKMHRRNVGCWNAMILGCVKSKEGPEALGLFQQMQRERVGPNATTFVALLQACAIMTALEDGRVPQKEIDKSRGESDVSDVHVGSSLAGMHVKRGTLLNGRFNKMCPGDIVSWTAMILRYVEYGKVLQALELLRQI